MKPRGPGTVTKRPGTMDKENGTRDEAINLMEASKGRIVGYAAAILSIALLTSIPLGLSHVKYLFAPWGRYQESIAYADTESGCKREIKPLLKLALISEKHKLNSDAIISHNREYIASTYCSSYKGKGWCGDSSIILRSFETGESIWEASSPGDNVSETRGQDNRVGVIKSIRFSPDDEYILSCGEKLQLWDARTGHREKLYSDINGRVNDAIFSPDGRYLVLNTQLKEADESHRRQGPVIRISAETGERLVTLAISEKVIVSSVAYSRDGKYILSRSGVDCELTEKLAEVCSKRYVDIWSAKSGNLLYRFSFTLGKLELEVPVPGGRPISYKYFQGIFFNEHAFESMLWSTLTGQKVISLKEGAIFGGPPAVCSFSSHGEYIACREGTDLIIISSRDGEKILTINDKKGVWLGDYGRFSSDGEYWITGRCVSTSGRSWWKKQRDILYNVAIQSKGCVKNETRVWSICPGEKNHTAMD